MHIGIKAEPTSTSIDIAVLARSAEDLGFESLWTPEHPVLPVKTSIDVPRAYGEYLDPFVALSRASAVTTTLKLGTGICLIPERNPLILAKEVASIDMVSKGRFILGVGVGSIREETEIMGGDFDHRWTQAREAAEAMKILWREEEAEFYGNYYNFPPVFCFPKPVQKPHPPIVLGSKSSNVFSRIIQWGDGWIPNNVTPQDIRHGRKQLDDLARASGRDPASLLITVFEPAADPDLVARFAAAGADRVVLPLTSASSKEVLSEMEQIASWACT